jgi:acyl carrier protein
VPVGSAIANTQLHVLDDRLEPLPIGMPGELYIGGVGLARGYVGLAELTRERFIDGPAGLGGRLYRTGDLARRRADGAIEILGRSDRQVKVRGFRVELAEIEGTLGGHPAIADCAVVPFGDGDRRRLAAYVVRRDGGDDVDALRSFLSERLPHYMLPSLIVPLERLPLTHAGKLDRRRLPDPERAVRPATSAPAVPQSDRERLLLEIWRQVLRITEVGVEDDFFALGGDSLGAAELVARVAVATGYELDIRELLAHPTVATLAQHLGKVGTVDVVAEQAPALAPRSQGPIAPAFIEIERRPLLGLFATGRIEPVDAAALAYLPASLAATLGMARDEVRDELFGGLPMVSGVLSTSLGRVGLILLPHFDDQLTESRAELFGSLREGAEVARQIGARAVSLTGLLPALTDYGRDLTPHAELRATPTPSSPPFTTGHATTAATVVLSIARMLAESGRDLSQETVAFLGLGSIGLASLRLLLHTLGEPERILLCDLYRKRDHLGAIRRELIDAFGVTARIDTLETRDELPDEVYQASLIVGATSAAGILDVARLRPYSLLVDDSAPHCFARAAAEKRLRERGDLLFTEGGVLQAPEPIPRLLHLPRGAEALAALLPSGLPGMPGVSRADEITGCVLSGLLSMRFAELAATIGEVTLEESIRHHERLMSLGFRGAPLHCEGFALPAESVARFRSQAAEAISVLA